MFSKAKRKKHRIPESKLYPEEKKLGFRVTTTTFETLALSSREIFGPLTKLETDSFIVKFERILRFLLSCQAGDNVQVDETWILRVKGIINRLHGGVVGYGPVPLGKVYINHTKAASVLVKEVKRVQSERSQPRTVE